MSEWLVDNRLSLHLGKTESILFGPKRKIKLNPNMKVVCNGKSISPRPTVKYLGVDLDQSLSGETMAGKVVNKVYARLRFLHRKGKYLDCDTRKLLASALIQCHYDYSCCFWYSSLTTATKSRLQISQNKLIRFTLNLPPRTHLNSEHFKALGWLPIHRRVDQLKLNHVYRVRDNKAPSYLNDYFAPTNHYHPHQTCFSRDSTLVVPHHGTYGQHTLRVWNKASADVRKPSQSLDEFKKRVKDYMYDAMLREEGSEYVQV